MTRQEIEVSRHGGKTTMNVTKSGWVWGCRLAMAALSAGLLASAGGASAQEYPARPVRVLVANSAGSLADMVSRLVFARLATLMGQSFLIENRAGAGGTLAGDAAAKAVPDGYTLLYASDSTLTIGPALYTLGYDPVHDFAPVSLVAKIPTGLVASPSLGVRNLDEFIALIKANPGKYNYGSGGPGHATHLGMELFLNRAGLDMVHVPYKGTGPALQAILSGEVAAVDLGLGMVLPSMQDGRLTPLAIIGPRSEGVLPQVPDLSRRVADAEYVSWQGVFAPVRTPRAIVDRLHEALGRAMASPEVKTRMLDTGMANVPSTPEELGRLVARDLKINGDMVRRLKLKAD
jgi:tripartite-type tricarboxylate transporter receptor subunit TctC